jgi:hypothetical protein
MTHATAPEPADDFGSRIPYVVPASLDELTGPASGVVELPVQLDWAPDTRYDLDDPDSRRSCYVKVLSEASTREELARYVDKDLLVETWPRLTLPRHCVRLWHDTFPELAALGSGNAWR